jgi:gliding motility-associated-like protein
MPENLKTANGSGVYSDENGELVVYSDGSKIWNKDHEIIYQGLLGDLGSMQPALFIPNPDNNSILYLFTSDILMGQSTVGTYYYTIDVTANSGEGKVMSMDNSLLADAVPVLAATRHSSENAYWVVTHQLGNNNFYAYKVNNLGISNSPVISSTGSSISPDGNTNEAISYLKFSPKGDKLAFVSFGKGLFEIFNFDSETGKISIVKQITPSFVTDIRRPYTIEFSPDGSKIYLTIINGSTQSPRDNVLLQYDLNNDYSVVQLNETSSKDIMAVQLAPDGKIYATRRDNTYMDIIENPDRTGVDCNFKEMGLFLDGVKGFTGLPNFVSSFLDIKPIDFDTKCHGDTTEFKVLNNSNTESILWDFGDEGSENNTLTTTNGMASHVFSEPGDYVVTYTENNGTKSWTHQIPVTIYPLPENNLRQAFPNDTAFIMKDGSSSIQLWAQEGMYSYEWTPGGTTDISYTVTAPGECSVTVEDMNCCRLKSTLFVEEFDPKIPNAIKRSSTLSNDINRVFKPLAPPDGVADYSMKIFNKWGQMLFESNDLSIGWDGKVNSTNAPEGIYLWYITLNVARNQMNKGMFKLSGTVMLLD